MAFICTQCGECCSNLGSDRLVLLLREDRVRISQSLDMATEKFEIEFCDRNEELSVLVGHSVYQLKSTDGHCVLLGSGNQCTVHPVKPFQCKYGPENFLRSSMATDYECMRDVDQVDMPEIEEYFFDTLVNGG